MKNLLWTTVAAVYSVLFSSALLYYWMGCSVAAVCRAACKVY